MTASGSPWSRSPTHVLARDSAVSAVMPEHYLVGDFELLFAEQGMRVLEWETEENDGWPKWLPESGEIPCPRCLGIGKVAA